MPTACTVHAISLTLQYCLPNIWRKKYFNLLNFLVFNFINSPIAVGSKYYSQNFVLKHPKLIFFLSVHRPIVSSKKKCLNSLEWCSVTSNCSADDSVMTSERNDFRYNRMQFTKLPFATHLKQLQTCWNTVLPS